VEFPENQVSDLDSLADGEIGAAVLGEMSKQSNPTSTLDVGRSNEAAGLITG
jgi:hypothetical protein